MPACWHQAREEIEEVKMTFWRLTQNQMLGLKVTRLQMYPTGKV